MAPQLLPPFPRNPLNCRACSKIAVFAERIALALCFLSFVGQHRTDRLLLRLVSDHGRPNIVSKVGVSREASQKKSKKRRAKTSPAFSLDVFRTFFMQHRVKHLLLRPFLYDVLRIRVVENTSQGS